MTVDSTAAIFDSQAELTGISTQWSLSRFVDIWNCIPGQTQVRKFSDRGKAVARIWRAIQPLASNGEPSEWKVEQPKKKSLRVDTKRPAQHKKRATPKNAANNAGHVNMKAAVIAMMKRARGATIAEIMQATSWQAHTVRGFISILGAKGGHKIESTQNAGERTYRAAK